MQPSKDPSAENIPSSSKSPGSKRRLHDQQRQSPALRGGTVPKFDPSTPIKRLKTSHSSTTFGEQSDMGKAIGSSRASAIDLTKGPSNFQPHTGAKRLVIKNLRTTSNKDSEKYYESIWRDLDNALTSIFKREQPTAPLEVLCRAVESTCRRERAEDLFKHLRDRCETFLNTQLLPIIVSQAGSKNVDALRTTYKHWTIWNGQSV